MTRKKKNEVAKSPQNSSEWHALLEREGLLLLWDSYLSPLLSNTMLPNSFFQKFSTNISKYDKYEVSACLTSTVAGRDPPRQSTSSLISSIVNSRLPIAIETPANMNLNISEY